MKKNILVLIVAISILSSCMKKPDMAIAPELKDYFHTEFLFSIAVDDIHHGCVSPDGFYLADKLSRQVIKVDRKGNEIMRIGDSEDPIEGDLGYIWDVSVSSGRVLLSHSRPGERYSSISIFNENGILLNRWSPTNSAREIVELDGYIYLACTLYDNLVWKYTREGELVSQFCENPKYASSGGICDLAFHRDRFYVTVRLPYEVYVFDRNENPLFTFGDMSRLACKPSFEPGIEWAGCYVVDVYAVAGMLIVGQYEKIGDGNLLHYLDIYDLDGNPLAMHLKTRGFPFDSDGEHLYYLEETSKGVRVFKWTPKANG